MVRAASAGVSGKGQEVMASAVAVVQWPQFPTEVLHWVHLFPFWVSVSYHTSL